MQFSFLLSIKFFINSGVHNNLFLGLAYLLLGAFLIHLNRLVVDKRTIHLEQTSLVLCLEQFIRRKVIDQMDGFRNDLVHIKCVRTRVDLLEHNIQGRNGVILLEDGKQSFLVVDNGGAGQVQSKQWVLRQTRVEYLLDLREVGKVMREPSQDPRQRETGNVSARRDHFIALRIHFSEQSHQQL